MFLYFCIFLISITEAAVQCPETILWETTMEKSKIFRFERYPLRVNYPALTDACAKNAKLLWRLYYPEGKIMAEANDVFEIRTQDIQKINDNAINMSLVSPDIVFSKQFYPLITVTKASIQKYGKMFQVAAQDMQLTLEGGDKVTYEMTTGGVVLNGSSSTDPSFHENENPMVGNAISWKCEPPFTKSGVPTSNEFIWKISDEYLEVDKTYNCTMTVKRTKIANYQKVQSVSQLVAVVPEIMPQCDVLCVENCKLPDAAIETVIEVKCGEVGTAKKKLEWLIEPKSKQDYVLESAQTENQTIVLPEKTFHPSDEINFIAKYNSYTANLTLKYREPQPVIEFVAEINPYFDPRSLIRITAECREDCDFYKVWYEVKPDDPKIFQDKEFLNIPAGTYKNDTKIQIITHAWRTEEVKDITLLFQIPQLKISCSGKIDLEPRDDTVCNASCIDRCEILGDWDWTIDGKTWTTTEGAVMTIPANTYKHDDKIMMTVKNEGGTAKLEVSFHNLAPIFNVDCINSNCMNPVSVLPIILKINCYDFCNHARYKWKIRPEPPSKWRNGLSANNTQLTIPADMFFVNETVEFEVTSEDKVYIGNFTYTEIAPIIKMKCVGKNCIDFNALVATEFAVTCDYDCISLKYIWTITPLPDDFSWAENIEFGPMNKTMKIRPRAMKDGQNVVIEVRSRGGQAEPLNITFMEPIPEIEVICVENCNKSNPKLSTKIEVICVEGDCSSYIWDIVPNAKKDLLWWANFTHTADNSSVTIKPYSYKHGNSITLNVTSGKAQAQIQLTFENPILDLAISCEPPCSNATNPLIPIQIGITCKPAIDCSKESFSWKLKPLKPNFSWLNNIKMHASNRSFVIAPKAFADGSKLTIQVLYGEKNQQRDASIDIAFVEPIPLLDIICDENCFGSDPLNETVVTAVCLRNCYKDQEFHWEFKPVKINWAYNISASANNVTIRVHPNVFRDNTTITFTVFSGKGNASRQFYFLEPTPKFIVKCIFNCVYNRFKSIFLHVACMNITYNSCREDNYNWTLSPTVKTFVMKKHTVYFKANQTLKILPNIFPDMFTTKVEVRQGKGVSTLIVTFMDPTPKLKIHCTDNCDYKMVANPLHKTKLNVICIEECESPKYIWSFDPPPPNFNPSKDLKYTHYNRIVEVRASAFSDGYSTQVTVKSGHGSAVINIYFIEPVALIKINCSSNCEPFADPQVNVQLAAHCINPCFDLKYTWDITPQGRDFTWKKYIRLGKDNKTLTILKGAYHDGEVVLVKLASRKAKDERELFFKIPPPTLDLKCDHCSQAYSYDKVTLKVRCLHSCIHLHYKWSITPLPADFNWTKSITLTSNNDSLTIKADTFTDGYSINVTVGTNDTYKSSTVMFVIEQPVLTITCAKNCGFNPSKSVVFESFCEEYCKKIKYNWQLNPAPYEPDLLITNERYFVIPAGMFEDGDTTEVTLFNGREQISEVITFHLPPWNGTCGIEPNEGVSGITQFSIECFNFQKGVTFRLYEDLPNKPGVLLAYGQNRFFKNIFLTETTGNTVNVVIGKQWNPTTLIRLPVTVSPFLLRVDDLNPISEKIFGNGPNDLNALSEKTNKNGFIQMVSLLDTSLRVVSEEEAVHWRIHLFEKTLKGFKDTDPLQSLSLMIKLSKSSKHTVDIMHLLMENVKESCKRMKQVSLNFPIEALEEYKKVLGELVAYLITETDNVPPSGEENLTEMDTTRVRNLYHWRSFIINLLRTTDCLFDLIKVDGNITTQTYDNLIYMTVDATPEDLNARTLHSVGNISSSSFLHMTEQLVSKLAAENEAITYNLAEYKINPFKFDEVILNTSSLLLFTIKNYETYIRDLPDQIKMYFAQETNGQENITDSVNGINVYEVPLPENSLFIISFQNVKQEYNFTLTSYFPNEVTLKELGQTITKAMQVSYQASGSSVFIGIESNNELNTTVQFGYVIYECMLWDHDDWNWQKKGCHPDPSPPSNFIVCVCNKLSLFAALSSAPPIIQHPLNSDLDLSPESTLLVAIIVGLVLLGCIFLMIWAHWRDILFQRTIFAEKLEDTIPGDSKMYMIMVVTGMMPNSGTSACISFQVIGTLQTGKVHILSGTSKKHFQRTYDDLFVFYEESNLGDLHTLRLWHNSEGNKPHWYCEQIIIQDVNNRVLYPFIIEKWFSLVRDEGLTTYAFTVIKDNAPASYWRRLRFCAQTSSTIMTLPIQKQRTNGYKESVAVVSITIILIMTLALLFVDAGGENIFGITMAVVFIEFIVSSIIDVMFRNAP